MPRSTFLENSLVLIAAGFFCSLTILAFFPGEMSGDTLDQLGQAYSGHYEDWHPPIMAAFWRCLLRLWNHPGILFIFHNLVFWILWGLFSISAFGKMRCQWMVLCLALLPSVWCQLAAVWKDTELSICLLGAFLFITLAQESEGRKERKPITRYSLLVLAGVFFLYATAVRLNAMPALIPLAWFFAAGRTQKYHSFKLLLEICLVLVFGLGTSFVLNYGILKASKVSNFQQIQINDIVGVYVRNGDEKLLPVYWKILDPRITGEWLRKVYDPEDGTKVLWTVGPIPATLNPFFLDELRRKWIEAIRAFPWVFLQDRWAGFKGIMRIGKEGSYYPFQTTLEPNRYGLKEGGDIRLSAGIKNYFFFFKDSFLFKGWPYMLLALACLWGNLKSIRKVNPWRGASIGSALSAILYGGSYFFCAPADDFRLLYPTVLLAVFSAVCFFAGRGSYQASDSRVFS